jgi:8-oxo-dGTP diphosphatase
MSNVSHDSETPAHGQQVITATALIHHHFDGVIKVFLPKRANTKKFLPDIYELPGGHVDFGEDIADGLRREVMEEFGVRISVGDPFACFTYINDVKGSHSIEVTYFATLLDPADKIHADPEDHSGFIWISKDEIDNANPMTEAESQNVHKAFRLLHGESIDFGPRTHPLRVASTGRTREIR